MVNTTMHNFNKAVYYLDNESLCYDYVMDRRRGMLRPPGKYYKGYYHSIHAVYGSHIHQPYNIGIYTINGAYISDIKMYGYDEGYAEASGSLLGCLPFKPIEFTIFHAHY